MLVMRKFKDEVEKRAEELLLKSNQKENSNEKNSSIYRRWNQPRIRYPDFRDVKDGLWYNYKIDEVATIEAWKKTPEKVLAFYNDRRKALDTVEPNDAHKALAKLEERFDVTVITQNVDDLHERGGSSNVLHIHGDLRKMRVPLVLTFCMIAMKISDW